LFINVHYVLFKTREDCQDIMPTALWTYCRVG